MLITVVRGTQIMFARTAQKLATWHDQRKLRGAAAGSKMRRPPGGVVHPDRLPVFQTNPPTGDPTVDDVQDAMAAVGHMRSMGDRIAYCAKEGIDYRRASEYVNKVAALESAFRGGSVQQTQFCDPKSVRRAMRTIKRRVAAELRVVHVVYLLVLSLIASND